jgi:large subunit ribosomal protein L23
MPVRDTREQPRHWFRPESKKYMTVEMEEPFVWPEIPDLEPWGQRDKQSEVDDAARSNGNLDSNDRREAAKKLREQVKKLLYKDVARSGQTQQLPEQLGEKESEAQAAREMEERMLKRMSRIKLWEKERTAKVVESDNRKRYAIKA